MLRLLDRHLVLSYLKSYLVCMVSMVGLFVVVDLFVNIEDYTNNKNGLVGILRHIGLYYSYKVIVVFDQLSEAIVLLAAMFTVAWMQRNNEVLPLLSAGVSARRIVQPVLLGASLMLVLNVLNQELVLPHVDNYVLENRTDPEGKQALGLNKTAYEPNRITIRCVYAHRFEQKISKVLVVLPAQITRTGLISLQADEAQYIAPSKGQRSGGWLLTGTHPPELENWERVDILEWISPGKYFLRTQQVDFEEMTRQRHWWRFIETWSLLQEIGKAKAPQQANVAVIFHMRLTRPLLGMILVFLGLSVILRDQNRNMFISAGMTLVLCVLFFATVFACKYLGDHHWLTPALAAWLPVIIFGPLSFVMFDAIHT